MEFTLIIEEFALDFVTFNIGPPSFDDDLGNLTLYYNESMIYEFPSVADPDGDEFFINDITLSDGNNLPDFIVQNDY